MKNMETMSEEAWLKKLGILFRKEKTHGHLKIAPKAWTRIKLLNRETDRAPCKETTFNFTPVLTSNDLPSQVMTLQALGIFNQRLEA